MSSKRNRQKRAENRQAQSEESKQNFSAGLSDEDREKLLGLLTNSQKPFMTAVKQIGLGLRVGELNAIAQKQHIAQPHISGQISELLTKFELK